MAIKKPHGHVSCRLSQWSQGRKGLVALALGCEKHGSHILFAVNDVEAFCALLGQGGLLCVDSIPLLRARRQQIGGLMHEFSWAAEIGPFPFSTVLPFRFTLFLRFDRAV